MLLVSPEQRLSLQLKQHEIWYKQETEVYDQVQQVTKLTYLDLLDESDELLHHR